jgi:uncharacterized membrane protein YhaH (DUF805 family)
MYDAAPWEHRMAIKYCASCGAHLHDSALSCSSCGSLNQVAASSVKSRFSFSGRIPRSTYWLHYAIPDEIIFILIVILADRLPDSRAAIVLWLVLFLTTFWHALAGNVKRAHDRGHSGWFLLLGLVPIANLVVGIQLGFMRGDVGPNQYGPDPLESPSIALASGADANINRNSVFR